MRTEKEMFNLIIDFAKADDRIRAVIDKKTIERIKKEYGAVFRSSI